MEEELRDKQHQLEIEVEMKNRIKAEFMELKKFRLGLKTKDISSYSKFSQMIENDLQNNQQNIRQFPKIFKVKILLKKIIIGIGRRDNNHLNQILQHRQFIQQRHNQHRRVLNRNNQTDSRPQPNSPNREQKSKKRKRKIVQFPNKIKRPKFPNFPKSLQPPNKPKRNFFRKNFPNYRLPITQTIQSRFRRSRNLPRNVDDQ